MKRIATITFIALSAAFSYGQSAFVPMGGTASGNGGTATYTIGQPAVQTTVGEQLSFAEGVQQPFEIMGVGVPDYPDIVLRWTLYPNPTRHAVTLDVGEYQLPPDGLRALLFNAYGQYVQQIDVHSSATAIDLSPYAPGNYYLKVYDGKKMLKTFKIVKTTLM